MSGFEQAPEGRFNQRPRRPPVVKKKRDVVVDPPAACELAACGRRIDGVFYATASRQRVCAPCAMAGGPEMRAKKYVRPRGQSVYQKVEG